MTGRFVILRHDHPEVHWDFMLETADVLKTWRLTRPPGPGVIDAIALPDHRLAYLDYEGPVSGGRGNVARWDRGVYERVGEGRLRLIGDVLRAEATYRQVDAGRWEFEFQGQD